MDRTLEDTKLIMRQIGYDNAPFNIEFFWNPETDNLQILEINPRISKSHSPLFHMVDGASQHKVAIDLALGRKPDMPQRQGREEIAAKFVLRSFEADGLIRHVPTQEEIDALERLLPDIEFNVLVRNGDQLTQLPFQESYSFELAELFLGGSNEEMLEDAYLRCLHSLPILIQPLPAPAPS